MPADDDHYVPNPEGPLARGLPPGYLRGWQWLRWRAWDGSDQKPGGDRAILRARRRFAGWVLLCLSLQWVAFNFLTPRVTMPFGLAAAAVNAALTPAPLFLFLALLLPALSFTAIVPPPDVAFRRALLFGLATAAALLLLIALVSALGIMDAYFHSHMSRADFLEAMGWRP